MSSSLRLKQSVICLTNYLHRQPNSEFVHFAHEETSNFPFFEQLISNSHLVLNFTKFEGANIVHSPSLLLDQIIIVYSLVSLIFILINSQ